MLESMGVNVSTLCSRTDKSSTTTTNRNERSSSLKDLEDLGSDGSADDWSKKTVAGTQRQRARLINASCNAFFLRRGLDPNLDWHPPLRGLVATRQGHLSGLDVPCHDQMPEEQ